MPFMASNVNVSYLAPLSPSQAAEKKGTQVNDASE
jgi:hypothetical protein